MKPFASHKWNSTQLLKQCDIAVVASTDVHEGSNWPWLSATATDLATCYQGGQARSIFTVQQEQVV